MAGSNLGMIRRNKRILILLYFTIGLMLKMLATETEAPAFDIPEIKDIRIDGKRGDWSKKGLRVETMAGESGEVQFPQDGLGPRPDCASRRLPLPVLSFPTLQKTFRHQPQGLPPPETHDSLTLLGGTLSAIFQGGELLCCLFKKCNRCGRGWQPSSSSLPFQLSPSFPPLLGVAGLASRPYLSGGTKPICLIQILQ
jgi:hypothetical protein